MGSHINRLIEQFEEVKRDYIRREVSERLERLPLRGLRKEDFLSGLLKAIVVGRSDSGMEITGPNGRDLDEFIDAEFADRPYLHPRPQKAAASDNPPQMSVQNNSFDMDRINPQMSDTELKQAYAAIAAALPKVR